METCEKNAAEDVRQATNRGRVDWAKSETRKLRWSRGCSVRMQEHAEATQAREVVQEKIVEIA